MRRGGVLLIFCPWARAVPSPWPTGSPLPSAHPSVVPSESPSTSAIPLSYPSSMPSDIPSTSLRPSSYPSSMPSESPSTSARPSSYPSYMPSDPPSMSARPSSYPSSMPSDPPSTSSSPSSAPSEPPSTSPTSSHAPSAIPSSVPSDSPSESAAPSASPSSVPSDPPSTSTKPSSYPSAVPSDPPSTSSAPSPEPTEPITFFAVGDVPYSDMERCLLPLELDRLRNSGIPGRFLVHLGDIRDGKEGDCPESLFQDVSDIFDASPIVPFFIPGDNGWLDCTDHDVAHSFWDTYLFRYDERENHLGLGGGSWPPLGTDVVRDETHHEFFAFLLGDVLFLGQGLPGKGRGAADPWSERGSYLDANAAWTERNFAAYVGRYNAVVIFGHGRGSINAPYFVALEVIAANPVYGRPPILFLEDNHWFATENNFRGLPNMYHIALDDTVTPTAITVDTNAAGRGDDADVVFAYDRRCWCSTSHRPTRLREGSSTFGSGTGCVAGECRDLHAQCAGERRCSPAPCVDGV